jgi:hypothetical protein
MSELDSGAVAATSARPRRPRRWLRYGILTFVLLFVVCPAVFYGVWTYRARAQLRAAIAAIPADEPLTTGELAEWYAKQGAGKEDITEEWLEALAPLENRELQRAGAELAAMEEIPPPGKPWSEESAVAAIIEGQQPLLRRLHLMAREEGIVHFPIGFEKGFTAGMAHIGVMPIVIRLLTAETRVLARRHDFDGAIECVGVQATVSNQLRNDPFALCALTRLAIQASGLKSIQWLN